MEDARVTLLDTILEIYLYGTTNTHGIACISDIPCTNYSVSSSIGTPEGKLKIGHGAIDGLTQTAITVEIRTIEFSKFVTIQPLDVHGRILPGAHIALKGSDSKDGGKTTGADGTVTYESVLYGSYKISVIAKDYEQVEPDKKYTVDEEVELFQPKMRQTSLLTSTPTAIPGFEALLTIASLLAVVTYLLRRRK